MKTEGEKGRAPLGIDEAAKLAGWIRSDGDAIVLEATGLSRQGAYRAAAGLSVQAGTRALVRQALRERGT